jgi:Na+/H+ antiporter NhaD/arsenite permease-like protein
MVVMHRYQLPREVGVGMMIFVKFLLRSVCLCPGTGGSLLLIGSAAGVAFMNSEKVSFNWYLTRITPWVMTGYAAGIVVYALQSHALLQIERLS